MRCLNRIKRENPLRNQRGSASVEFAILLPAWLLMFFGFLDYGWYLTNLVVMENAVAAGARAGVKVAYWLDSGDPDYEDPEEIAKAVVKNAFNLSSQLKDTQIDVTCRDKDMEDSENSGEPVQYLEVAVSQFTYQPIVGYLPDALMPKHISAFSLAAFP